MLVHEQLHRVSEETSDESPMKLPGLPLFPVGQSNSARVPQENIRDRHVYMGVPLFWGLFCGPKGNRKNESTILRGPLRKDTPIFV